MDFSEKSYARQKFRSNRGRGRGGRGGSVHGGYHGGHSRKARTADLDSNAFRYEDETDQVEDGVVVPKSQGADLEALLADAEVAFNQAFYRFRGQVQDIADEAPPLGGTHPEQLLAIDLNQLSASLAALPLHALLGLEPHYLEGMEPQDVPQQPTRPPPAAPAAPSRQVLHASADAKSTAAPVPVVPVGAKLPPAAGPPVVQKKGALGYGGPTSQPAPPPPVSLAAAPAAMTAPGGDTPQEGGDDDDSELAALLMGRAPVRQPQQAASVPPAPLPPVLSAVIGAAGRGYAGTSGSGGRGLAGLAVTSGRGGGGPGTVTLAPSSSSGSARGAVGLAGGTVGSSAGGIPRVAAQVAAGPVSTALPGGFAVRSGPAGPLGGLGAAGGPLGAVGAATGRLVTPVPGKAVLAAASVPRAGEPRPPAGAVGGGSAGGGGGGGAMDEELARLLGLPVMAGGAKTPAPQPPAAAVPAATQVLNKVGVRPSTAALGRVSGSAALPPPQQPGPPKSLDDWLKDL